MSVPILQGRLTKANEGLPEADPDDAVAADPTLAPR
jgi:hypothetical protein